LGGIFEVDDRASDLRFNEDLVGFSIERLFHGPGIINGNVGGLGSRPNHGRIPDCPEIDCVFRPVEPTKKLGKYLGGPIHSDRALQSGIIDDLSLNIQSISGNRTGEYHLGNLEEPSPFEDVIYAGNIRGKRRLGVSIGGQRKHAAQMEDDLWPALLNSL
jgi:hypothetical protein